MGEKRALAWSTPGGLLEEFFFRSFGWIFFSKGGFYMGCWNATCMRCLSTISNSSVLTERI